MASRCWSCTCLSPSSPALVTSWEAFPHHPLLPLPRDCQLSHLNFSGDLGLDAGGKPEWGVRRWPMIEISGITAGKWVGQSHFMDPRKCLLCPQGMSYIAWGLPSAATMCQKVQSITGACLSWNQHRVGLSFCSTLALQLRFWGEWRGLGWDREDGER